MYNCTEIDNRLINKINEILEDFKDFEQAIVNSNGDIVIRKKILKKKVMTLRSQQTFSKK